MAQKFADIYPDIHPAPCSEHGCNVKIPLGFVSYCVEVLRDKVYPTSTTPMEICDCIVVDRPNNKISLIELKSSVKHIDSTFVEKVRAQLYGGRSYSESWG